MKLAHIVYPGLGGVASVVFSLIESQQIEKKNKSYENTIIFYGNVNLNENYLNKCKKNKIEFFFIKKKNYFLDFFKLFSLLIKINPYFVVNHGHIVGPFKIFSIFYLKKYVYVDHTPDKIKKTPEWFRFILSIFLADKVIFVSKKQTNGIYDKLLNFFKKKSKIIINSVNTNIYNRNKNKKKNNNLIKIGMAARFVDDKNHDLLIELVNNNRKFFKKKKNYF